MLGQPLSMLIPQVVGFRLHGKLREGATATDLVLTVTADAAQEGRGRQVRRVLRRRAWRRCRWPTARRSPTWRPSTAPPAASSRSTTRRCATCASRAGAEQQVELVEAYASEQGLFHDRATPRGGVHRHAGAGPRRRVEPSVAGPKRPQDRVSLFQTPQVVRGRAAEPGQAEGQEAAAAPAACAAGRRRPTSATRRRRSRARACKHGSVVIAAITSCTNTSNPSVMLAAGPAGEEGGREGAGDQAVGEDVAGARVEGGDRVPGRGRADAVPRAARVPHRRLRLHDLHRQLGPAARSRSPTRSTTATWSSPACCRGNRNFEGRINPEVRANYLMSPPLVVAYALAGRIDIDLDKEPLGNGRDGKPVFLRDIWPTPRRGGRGRRQGASSRPCSSSRTRVVFEGDEHWRNLRRAARADRTSGTRSRPTSSSRRTSSGCRKTPRRGDATSTGARVLAVLGDSVTTDHISPAGQHQEGRPGRAST